METKRKNQCRVAVVTLIGNNLEKNTCNEAELNRQIELNGWSGKSRKSALCYLLMNPT